MRTLFLDTSTADVTVSIVEDNKILSCITKSIPNKHSIYTVSFLDEVIKNADIEPDDIDRIMVVTGPGSFTGVRIGVTIAKTYAYLRNLDIICVSSLKMRALSLNHNYCMTLIDARHNNYYLGLYDKDNNEVIEECFASLDYVKELIDKYDLVIVSNENIMIDNIEVLKQELDILKIVSYYQDKPSKNPHLVVPNYLKLPQALEEKHD